MDQKLKYGGAALGGVLVTLIAGGIAFAAHGDRGLGPFGNADADNNGEITRTEWVAAANKRFDSIDTNKDGKLIVGEIPPAPEPRHHGRRHGPPGPEAEDDAPPPPPAEAPAGNSAQ
jgi:hypothetical protein